VSGRFSPLPAPFPLHDLSLLLTLCHFKLYSDFAIFTTTIILDDRGKMNVGEWNKYKKSIVTKVLTFVWAVLVKSSIGIGIGNTFCKSIVTGIDNSFHKYC